MHDIRFIRENPAAFDDGLGRRGIAPQSAQILELDAFWRGSTAKLQELQSARNEASKKIGQAKARKDEAEAQRLMSEVARLKDEIPAMELRVRETEESINDLLSTIPNLPAASAWRSSRARLGVVGRRGVHRSWFTRSSEARSMR